MVRLRRLVRDTNPTKCHDFICQLYDTGRLLQCFTQNINGLQTRERRDMSEVVVELHGNNAHLVCHKCQRQPQEDIEWLDERIMREGKVCCSFCEERGETFIYISLSPQRNTAT
jgi:NAD-dependent SIR2 family protein deacetylase